LAVLSAVVVRSGFFAGWALVNADSVYLMMQGKIGVHWTEITLIGGSCAHNVFVLWGNSISISCTLAFDCSNLTDHAATSWGAAGYYNSWSHLNLEFSRFDSNTGPGGLLFGSSITASHIRCLAVRSNACVGTSSFDGLFRTEGALPLTIDGTVIKNNTVLYFVGTSGFTFSNCYFDAFDLPVKGTAAFGMLDCEMICTELLVAPVCVSGTPMSCPARSSTPSMVFCQTIFDSGRQLPTPGFVSRNSDCSMSFSASGEMFARSVGRIVLATGVPTHCDDEISLVFASSNEFVAITSFVEVMSSECFGPISEDAQSQNIHKATGRIPSDIHISVAFVWSKISASLMPFSGRNAASASFPRSPLLIPESRVRLMTTVEETGPFPPTSFEGSCDDQLLSRSVMKTTVRVFLSNFFGRISRSKSSMNFLMSQDVQSRVSESQNLHKSAEGSHSDSFLSENLRFSADSALSVLPTNTERTDPLPVSRQNVPTDLSLYSLFAFSQTSVQTVCTDAMTSEGPEARIDRASVSIGAIIGGLLVLLAVAVAVFIVIHWKRRRNQTIDDQGSVTEVDVVEAVSALKTSDRYIDQEKSDQIRSEVRLSLLNEP
jgi:hypothetical protein